MNAAKSLESRRLPHTTGWACPIALALVGLLLTQPSSAQACATCFGASDSNMATGMNMGILSLLIVVVFVLSGLAAFFVFLARRAALTPMPGDSAQTLTTPK